MNSLVMGIVRYKYIDIIYIYSVAGYGDLLALPVPNPMFGVGCYGDGK